MNIRSYKGRCPRIDATAWIDPSAQVIGDVVIGAHSSVWPLTTIRGDVNAIRIGAGANIQDHSVLHVTHRSPERPAGFPLTIGDDVTVGHGAILHGCTIGNLCLIGMGATLLDGATLHERVLLAAGSLVPQGKTLEGGWLWRGSPARRARRLAAEEERLLEESAQLYRQLKAEYAQAGA